MLLVGLATLIHGLRSELHQAVAEFTVSPVELWIGGIAKPKGHKSHLSQTSWSEASASKSPPEDLAVCWQLALASRRYGYKYELVVQKLFLPCMSTRQSCRRMCRLARTRLLAFSSTTSVSNRIRSTILPSSSATSCAFPVSDPYRTSARRPCSALIMPGEQNYSRRERTGQETENYA